MICTRIQEFRLQDNTFLQDFPVIFSEQIESESELTDIVDLILAEIKYLPAAVLLLEGEMGAGKTTFTRTLTEALATGPANSPTFNILNIYNGSEKMAARLVDIREIYHYDFYRIRNREDLIEQGFDFSPDRPILHIIEWWSRMGIPETSAVMYCLIIDYDVFEPGKRSFTLRKIQ